MLRNLPIDQALMITCAALVACGVLVLLIVQHWRRRPTQKTQPQVDLYLDIATLDDRGPLARYPRLEIYGTPVRLAVLVVAPSGRNSELPPPAVLPGIMERLVPGLTEIVATHQPLVRRWPEQLSSQGFNQAFFNNLALPGTRGKGTPWCSLAGKLMVGDRQFLVGMVCNSGSPNSLGQIVVEHEGQWLNTLRVREKDD